MSSSSSHEDGNNNIESNNKIDSRIWPLHSMRSLGLLPPLVQPCIESISQLPEVKELLTTTTTLNSLETAQESLHRSTDIFGQMKEGGDEHLALLALSAEYFSKMGLFDRALQSLQTLEQVHNSTKADDNNNNNNNNNNKNHIRVKHDLILARAKAHWYHGQFAESKAICDQLLTDAALLQRHLPLHFACARQGQALSRLLLAETLDDAFALKDYPRMVVKILEQYKDRMPATPLSLALYNHGISQVIWAQIVGRINNVEAPIDGAMKAWKEALTRLERERNSKRRKGVLSMTLQARLNTQLAWGVLEMAEQQGMDDTPKAMELAGQALSICDKINKNKDQHVEGMASILTLLASCYQKSGQAVTAEGLLQSALDEPVVGPQQALEKRQLLNTYSQLLKDWEKREGQGEKMQAEAQNMVVGPGWENKSPIFASLWFWTPTLFLAS